MKDKIPYMISKRLSSGATAYYFNLPAHRRPDGFPASKALGTDYLQAAKEAIHLNAELAAVKKEKRPVASKNSLADIYNKYADPANRFYADLAKNTKTFYEYTFKVLSSLKNSEGESFATVNLSEMDFRTAEKLYFNLYETRGINISKRCMVFLRMLYNWAVKYGYYKHPNPFDKMRVKTPLPKKRVITFHQILALLRAARKIKHVEVRLAIHINYWICQRPADVLGLMRNDFYIKDGFGFFKIKQNKTGVEVSPALPPNLSRIIARMGQGAIIRDHNGNAYSVNWFSRAFARVKKEAGIENVFFKDLRHTGTTAYVDAGVGSTQVIAITGHTTEGIMNRVYRKNTEKQSVEALKKRLSHSDSQK